MGKTGKAAKRRRREMENETVAFEDEESTDAASYLGGLVSPGEVAVAARTLSVLAANPTVLAKSKNELKNLRGAAFDFQRVHATLQGTGNTLTSRISAALSTGRYTDALVLLSELRLRSLSPKLGALQRWTRECDAASRADGSFGDTMVLRVLDAILRSTVETDALELPAPLSGNGPVRRHAEYVLRENSGQDLWAQVESGELPTQQQKQSIKDDFWLLQETSGPDRLPPNHYPALLYASRSTAIPLSHSPISTQRFDVPNVPGAFLLEDALNLSECRDIVAACEAIGFKPDRPVGEEGVSVLAHNVYWLAHKEFLDTFWARFAHLLPQEHSGGGKVTGLNARFRVYRYEHGHIYRPHVDGAWPASGIDAQGNYLYDSSPIDNSQWSRLTFLIYLNDVFDNGCTTFFLPTSTEGIMNAYPVKPIAGSVLVFPHGDARGSLLHEGSPVGKGGVKYVIRTEVLYETKPGKTDDGQLEV